MHRVAGKAFAKINSPVRGFTVHNRLHLWGSRVVKNDYSRPIGNSSLVHNLWSSFLKLLVVVAETMLSSSEFHKLITLSVKKCWRSWVLKRFFLSLKLCPLVWPELSKSKKTIKSCSGQSMDHLINFNKICSISSCLKWPKSKPS